jgi:hypothetical protein
MSAALEIADKFYTAHQMCVRHLCRDNWPQKVEEYRPIFAQYTAPGEGPLEAAHRILKALSDREDQTGENTAGTALRVMAVCVHLVEEE